MPTLQAIHELDDPEAEPLPHHIAECLEITELYPPDELVTINVYASQDDEILKTLRYRILSYEVFGSYKGEKQGLQDNYNNLIDQLT